MWVVRGQWCRNRLEMSALRPERASVLLLFDLSEYVRVVDCCGCMLNKELRVNLLSSFASSSSSYLSSVLF